MAVVSKSDRMVFPRGVSDTFLDSFPVHVTHFLKRWYMAHTDSVSVQAVLVGLLFQYNLYAAHKNIFGKDKKRHRCYFVQWLYNATNRTLKFATIIIF